MRPHSAHILHLIFEAGHIRMLNGTLRRTRMIPENSPAAFAAESPVKDPRYLIWLESMPRISFRFESSAGIMTEPSLPARRNTLFPSDHLL